MQAVILAGGVGSRLSEETQSRPKPMVEVGGKPLLWHIMKLYAYYGIDDFIICCGYKGYMIKEYFANYFLHMADVTFNMRDNTMEVHQNYAEPWRVTLVDTGENTLTGGRLKRVRDFIGEGPFCFTYGDGLSNVNISELIGFHKARGSYATVTAIQPPGRFGVLRVEQDMVDSFAEKPVDGCTWINGGFFVLEPEVFRFIQDDGTAWERGPLENLARAGQLAAFKHRGFWRPMDTLRDKMYLEELWQGGKAPWKLWK